MTALDELMQYPQWVAWKAKPKGNGKTDKIPINPHTGDNAKSNDRSTWGTYQEATRAVKKYGLDGIGFEFTDEDPFVGFDFDDCRDPDTGRITLQAEAYLDRLHSFSEVSPSGCGLRIIVKGQVPGKRKRSGKDIEIYSTGQFLTITEEHLVDTPDSIENRQKEVDEIYKELFGEDKKEVPQQELSKDVTESLTDEEILSKVRKAANSDKFEKLYRGETGDYPSASEADLALCDILGFWTQNPGQIDRLFRGSKLYRKKWDSKRGDKTYGWVTIEKAVASATETYSPSPGNGNLRLDEVGLSQNDLPHADLDNLAITSISAAIDTTLQIGARIDIRNIHPTDLGNAKRFAVQYGDKIRFNWTMGQWLYYDGIRWNPDTGKATAQRFAFEIAQNILNEAVKIVDSEKRKKLAKWSFASESSKSIRALLELSKALTPIECYGKDFDTDRYLLNLNNGTLDLRTGKLRKHNPDDMISKLAPVTWTGEKSSLDGKQLWLPCCYTWMEDNDEALDYLQRLGGYCLTGDITSRVFPIFWGSGKNGKNAFLDTLAGILGDYAMTAPRTLLMESQNEEHATELAGLIKMRLVVASETKTGKKLKISLVKAMTGNKKIRGRFMRQDYFEFDHTHKTILMTQNLPIIDEITDAIWDRLHRVEWPVRIPDNKQDHHLTEKLEAEWPFILGWFIEGCLKWQKDGYLKSTKAIAKGTEEYRSDMNPLSDFITECCIAGKDEFVGKKQLKDAFDTWTTDKRPMGSRTFTSLLRAIGNFDKVKKVNGKPVKCWIGLRLRDNNDE